MLLTISLRWPETSIDGAAQAARARQPPATLPDETDHPPVHSSEKAEAETWPDAEIISAFETNPQRPMWNTGASSFAACCWCGDEPNRPDELPHRRQAASMIKEKVQPIAQAVFGVPVRGIVLHMPAPH
jgi:hypothetical protein